MRKLVAHLQTTLNNRIATATGTFWEPFPWGQEEIRYVNQAFAAADTWAMSRPMYDVIAPWWDVVAAGGVPEDVAELGDAEREFGEIYAGLTKVVFSTTLPPAAGRTVISGDLAGRLAELKAAEAPAAASTAVGRAAVDAAAARTEDTANPEDAGAVGTGAPGAAAEDPAGAVGRGAAGADAAGAADTGVAAGTSAAGADAAGAGAVGLAVGASTAGGGAPRAGAGPVDPGSAGAAAGGAALPGAAAGGAALPGAAAGGAALPGAAGGGGVKDIVLSCGPATLAPLAAAPGLIDEYLLVIHPAVVAEGRPMFEGLTADIALELRESRVFDGGAVVLRYGVIA